jgi:hypothetical protein
MSSCFFTQHIFSHFLLDLYGLTGYIHNQLANEFPPVRIHPNKWSVKVAPVHSEAQQLQMIWRVLKRIYIGIDRQ